MKRIEHLKPTLNTWAPLLCDLFYEKKNVEFASAVKREKIMPFNEIFDFDSSNLHSSAMKPFECLRRTPLNKLKAIYIREKDDDIRQQLQEIELDIFDRFNLTVSTQTDFNWLYEQGIMIFPMKYTWGNSPGEHDKWNQFTLEILKLILLQKPVLVSCGMQEVVSFIIKNNLDSPIIGRGPGCWQNIKDYVDDSYDETVEWDPWIYGK